VVVDDYIPVNKITKKPLFTYSKDEGEMWPCLMEKAYAKLQGSYSHLDGGFPLSSLVDFTGGFPERYWGPPGGVLAGRDEEQVWQALVTTFKQEREALVCTSTPAWVSKQGLLGGHAYTVTGARQLQEDQRLVRVRNPWGQTEWTGAFSKRWILNSGLNRATQNLLSTGGGEFWIPFKDYLKNFDVLSIVHLLDPKSWVEARQEGEWGLQHTCKQFQLTVDRECEVMVALDQKFRRQQRDEMDSEDTLLPIQLTVAGKTEQFRKLRTRTWKGQLGRGNHILQAVIRTGKEKVQFSLWVAACNTQLKLTEYK